MLRFFILFFFPVSLLADSAIFRISIYSFPRNFQPQLQSSSTSYLFQNIFRNLYLYSDKGLVPDLAESCKRTSQGRILTCTLRKNLKWSNGEKLTAQDFLDTYKQILDSKNKFLRPDLLFSVKNAEEIYLGTKPMTTLGVTSPAENKIQFEFFRPDGEFEYNLSLFFLAPTKGTYELKSDTKIESSFYTNGPYRIKNWEHGKSISLESNPYYNGQTRPPVEFVVIDEDTVGLRLYENNEMGMVRRLPTLLIPKYRDRKDFYSIPVLRFDYLGMGLDLAEKPELRKKLATSLQYPEWQQLLFSKGRPGCVGLPPAWFGHPNKCFEFQKPTTESSQSASSPILRFYYSLQGGDDHRRTAEWLQTQWKKNAGLEVQVRGLENKTFLAELMSTSNLKAPSIFRKGLSPDRPTCSGILENFTSNHPENYIRNKSPEFDKLVEELRRTQDNKKKKKLCQAGFDFLLKRYLLIPTGPFDFSMLISPRFAGWKFTELNYLDLTHLKESSKTH